MAETPRKILQLIKPQHVIEGAGVHLRRSFAPDASNVFDPFLLFDHFSFKDPVQGPIAGFPTHPHRGIETVTYMLEGFTRHRDSLGNIDTIGPGDIQWMTAGRGILHEEMPRRGENGLIDGFQLWVNLPASQKMTAPRYQGVLSDEIPVAAVDGARVRVIAGNFGSITGPVTEIAAQPVYLDISLEPGAGIDIPVMPGHSAVAYLFEGEGIFGIEGEGTGYYVQATHMIHFDDGSFIRVRGGHSNPARFMLMAGAPFQEPIFPYGPFVMNTREEIIQAFHDLRNGTFVD